MGGGKNCCTAHEVKQERKELFAHCEKKKTPLEKKKDFNTRYDTFFISFELADFYGRITQRLDRFFIPQTEIMINMKI